MLTVRSAVLYPRRSPPAAAVAQVTATLLGISKHELAKIPKRNNLPNQSILVLNLGSDLSPIRMLKALRRKNFPGGVLLLSRESLPQLARKERILVFGANSHVALVPPWRLPAILITVTSIKPVSEGNMAHLQWELELAYSGLRERVASLVQRLRQLGSGITSHEGLLTLQELQSLLATTPAATHSQMESEMFPGGASIAKHFQTILVGAQSHMNNEASLRQLEKVLEKWCELVMNLGERIPSLVAEQENEES